MVARYPPSYSLIAWCIIVATNATVVPVSGSNMCLVREARPKVFRSVEKKTLLRTVMIICPKNLPPPGCQGQRLLDLKAVITRLVKDLALGLVVFPV